MAEVDKVKVLDMDKLKGIFTSEGWLGDVVRDPGLDFCMNLFGVQRVFAVGGFDGTWSVAKHSFLTAVLAIFWARENDWAEEKRNKLVVRALFHDMHESLTGDVLPQFKSLDVKEKLNWVQGEILKSLGLKEDDSLTKYMKLIDLIAFLYEIREAPVQILDAKKVGFRSEIIARQNEIIFEHCRKVQISKKMVRDFLKKMNLL